jgi:hypothetical protein
MASTTVVTGTRPGASAGFRPAGEDQYGALPQPSLLFCPDESIRMPTGPHAEMADLGAAHDLGSTGQ